MKVHYIGKVVDKNAERGILKLERIIDRELYHGKAPKGSGAGIWFDTLVPVIKPDVIRMVFHSELRKEGTDDDEVTSGSDVYSLQVATKNIFMSEEKFTEIIDTIKLKKNIILQGPPGVGKTFIARRLAYSILGYQDDRYIEFVQFHQSYSYEDFIQGFRPSVMSTQ